jgi:hypothetical protein
MSTIARAWDALMRALAEASELHRGGADANSIAELLQHARELLDIIDDEISVNGLKVPGGVLGGLAQMRERLAIVERSLVTRH